MLIALGLYASVLAIPVWSDIFLNEFVAVTAAESGLTDEDGQIAEWIELYNSGPAPVDLANLTLSDNPEQPDQWRFPALSLGPGNYLVVFASGKDRRQDRDRLHTNFKLRGSGEYLGLFNLTAGPAALSELNPGFPEQRAGYSYGRDPGGRWGYFATPTPGGSQRR